MDLVGVIVLGVVMVAGAVAAPIAFMVYDRLVLGLWIYVILTVLIFPEALLACSVDPHCTA